MIFSSYCARRSLNSFSHFFVCSCSAFSYSAMTAVTFIFGLGMGCGQPITTMLIFGRTARGRSGEILGLRQSVNNAVRVAGPAAFGGWVTRGG